MFWKDALKLMHMGTRLSILLLLFAVLAGGCALVVPNHGCPMLGHFP